MEHRNYIGVLYLLQSCAVNHHCEDEDRHVADLVEGSPEGLLSGSAAGSKGFSAEGSSAGVSTTSSVNAGSSARVSLDAGSKLFQRLAVKAYRVIVFYRRLCAIAGNNVSYFIIKVHR